MVKVEYVLNRDDYFHYLVYDFDWRRTRRRTQRRKRWWYWPVVGACNLVLFGTAFAINFVVLKWFFTYFLPGMIDQDWIFYILAGVAASLLIVVFSINPPWETRFRHFDNWRFRLLAWQGDKLGRLCVGYRCELSLTAEEVLLIAVKENVGDGYAYSTWIETRANWDHVSSIDDCVQHAFVRTEQSGCLFIPKRAFPDEIAFRQFVETARRYQRDASATTAITAKVPLSLDASASSSFHRRGAADASIRNS